MRAPLIATLLLASCNGDAPKPRPTPTPVIEQPQPALTSWQIGPWAGKLNYSKNCPLHPTSNPDGSFWFDIGPCEPHYVTGPTGSLANKSRIRARFRIEGDGVIHGANCPASSPSTVTLYFEEANTNWSEDGYRWWASFASSAPLKAGSEFEIVAPLNGRWTSVVRANSHDNPDLFARGKANAGRAGFTFANCTGYGHGAVATKPVRFTVLEFKVE